MTEHDLYTKAVEEEEEEEEDCKSISTLPSSPSRSHRQDSSTSSIDSAVSHSSTEHGQKQQQQLQGLHTTPLKSNNGLNGSGSGGNSGSSSTTHRKRLSMNFKTLPVMAPNSTPHNHHHSYSPSVSNNTITSPSPSSRRRTISDAPFPDQTRQHSPMASPLLSSSHALPPSSTTTQQDAYLATLAAKERRVVELKDEFKRVRDMLRLAEDDLTSFRGQASFAIHVPEQKPSLHQADYFQSPPNLPRPHLAEEVKSPPQLVQQIDQPQFSSPVITAPSAAVEEEAPPFATEFANAANRGGTTEVFSMGKRVVEELGTQFWGLFDDIKNATVGEEPRQPGNALSRSGSLRRDVHQSDRLSHQPQQHRRKQSLLSQNSNNASENSYYYI